MIAPRRDQRKSGFRPTIAMRDYPRFKAALMALALLLATSVFILRPESAEDGALKIAVGDDAAGLIISLAATMSREKVKVEAGSDISFLKIADCCGSQAEFALAAGKFDLAVLCPDAAEEFLGSDRPFRLLGEIVRNANILVSIHSGPVQSVGYMNGRVIQTKILADNLNSAPELQPIMTAALPYALERETVDAVVLDILTVTRGEAVYHCRALPFEAPASVLVARENVLGSPVFRSFLNTYNDTVDQLNGDGLADALRDLIPPEKMKDKLELWRNMKVSYIHIPAAN